MMSLVFWSFTKEILNPPKKPTYTVEELQEMIKKAKTGVKK